MLRRIFGFMRGDVTGEWIILHNKELHALYSSPNIIQVIKLGRLKWAGYVAHMVESRGALRTSAGKPEGRRPLGKSRHRWEDNIKMDIKDVLWDQEWTDLAQNRARWRVVLIAVINFRVL
jgi:hypothetical protein